MSLEEDKTVFLKQLTSFLPLSYQFLLLTFVSACLTLLNTPVDRGVLYQRINVLNTSNVTNDIFAVFHRMLVSTKKEEERVLLMLQEVEKSSIHGDE
jgi:hypothetical protein